MMTIRTLSIQKIFLGILAAHVTFIALGLIITSDLTKKFQTMPITPIELVAPGNLAPAPPAMQIPAEPEKPDIPFPEEKPRPKPKKIIKKIEKIEPPTSELKKRLEQRLSQVKTPAGASRPAAVAGALPGQRFAFSWYNSFVHTRLHTLWKQPSRSAVKVDNATAVVAFRVFRDGHIEGVSLRRPSGSTLMDQSVIQAVKMADPLPPLPGSFTGQFEDFEILFELSK